VPNSKYSNTDIYVYLNGVDLSNWAFSIDTPQQKDQIDVSGFNPTGSREFVPGTEDATLTVSFRQDFGSGGPHQTLQTLYASGSAFPFQVRRTSSSVSSTNPKLSGTAVMYEYNGLSGQLNAAGEFTATFKPGNGSVWAWATA
jgi:hypothetical protein